MRKEDKLAKGITTSVRKLAVDDVVWYSIAASSFISSSLSALNQIQRFINLYRQAHRTDCVIQSKNINNLDLNE